MSALSGSAGCLRRVCGVEPALAQRDAWPSAGGEQTIAGRLGPQPARSALRRTGRAGRAGATPAAQQAEGGAACPTDAAPAPSPAGKLG